MTRIVLPTLYHIIRQHLIGWHIAFFYDKTRILFRAAFGISEKDVEAVEHVADLDTILLGKHLASVKIFVGRELVVGHQPHYYAEQILLPFQRFFRKIQCCIFILVEVELPVYHAHPLQIGIGNGCVGVCVVEVFNALRQYRAIVLLSVASSFGAGASAHDAAVAVVLGKSSGGYGCEHKARQQYFAAKCFHMLCLANLLLLPLAKGRG